MKIAAIAQHRGAQWGLLFAAILACWGALYAMSLPADLRATARIYGAEFWESLCVVTPDAAGYARVTLMWVLMAGGMMAPTALPAFAAYDDLGRADDTRFGMLVAGYLVIWIGFAAVAAALQMGLFAADLISAIGESRSVLLSAGLLALAGAYQFSPVKEACLAKCRAPLTFFMQHWDEGPLRMGLRLGAVCLGCCWALMLLAFVGGVMNLAFMGLAMVIMVIEKLPDLGRHVTRPLGFGLIAAAALLGAGAVV